MLDRQTEHLRVVAGEDVAEVAGRNDELDLVAHVDDLVLQQLRVSGEVVDDLRHQTAHVDGVGGGKHFAASSLSPKMRLTADCASSKLPSTAHTFTFAPACVLICSS